MVSQNWWQRLVQNGRHASIRRHDLRRSTRLMELENLEDRMVPATIFVHNTADGMIMNVAKSGGTFTAPNLRSAVDFANHRAGADTIKLDNTTYFLENAYGGQLNISSVLTIKNRFGGSNLSTIDAQDQSRIFLAYGGSMVLLDHLILTHGNAPTAQFGITEGGAILNQGRLTVLTSQFIDNHAYGFSGAEGNQPREAQGGAIYNGTQSSTLATLTIYSSTFASNTAEGGADNKDGYNGAGADGGAIAFGFGSGPSSITASTFASNQARAGDSYNNGGDAYGGAIAAEQQGVHLNIVNSTVANNAAYGGNSYGSSYGGSGGNAFGGAIASRDGGSTDNVITLVNDTITMNQVVGGEGSYGGSGAAYGGGVANLGPLFRQAFDDGNVVNVLNTIIAGNEAHSTNSGNADDVFGEFHSLQHNLIGTTNNSNGFTASGDLLGVNPEFDPAGLQDNGGPTETIALLVISPAVNAGNNGVATTNNFLALGIPKLTTDQRGKGFPRKVNTAVDIGAYELKLNLDKFYTFRSMNHAVVVAVPPPGLLLGSDAAPLPPNASHFCVHLEGSPPGGLTDLVVNLDGSFSFTIPPRFRKTGTFQFRLCVDYGEEIVDTNFVFTATIKILGNGGRGSAGAFLGL